MNYSDDPTVRCAEMQAEASYLEGKLDELADELQQAQGKLHAIDKLLAGWSARERKRRAEGKPPRPAVALLQDVRAVLNGKG